jgi:hypothetical protein
MIDRAPHYRWSLKKGVHRRPLNSGGGLLQKDEDMGGAEVSLHGAFGEYSIQEPRTPGSKRWVINQGG